MRITAVTIHDVDTGRNAHTNWNPVVIRVDTDQGISGVGELGLAYGTGAKAGIAMIRTLAEWHLLGADPFRIEAIWETFFRRTFWGQGGGPVVYGAMSAIDEALWDIKGKALGVPIYELLGGRMWDEIRVYANGWYTGLVSPEEYAEGALKVVADGYDAMKLDPFGTTPDGRLGVSAPPHRPRLGAARRPPRRGDQEGGRRRCRHPARHPRQPRHHGCDHLRPDARGVPAVLLRGAG